MKLDGIEADSNQIVQGHEIAEDFAIDLILMNLASYQKNRKYQSSVTKLLIQKTDNESKIEDQAKLFEANGRLEELIENRNEKIKIWTEELRKNQSSKIHATFLEFLNHERSVLLIWLLTQRLH